MRDKIANYISNIFNAYLSITIAEFLVIYTQRELIPNWEVIIILIIFIKLSHVLLFKYFGLISDFEISDRSQRPLFNLAGTIPNLVVIYIATTASSELFLLTSVILFSLNLILFFISIFWKMSGHMTYLSFLATITTLLFFNWMLLIFWIVVIPLVAWSRVQLKRHTVAQVIAGTIVGCLVTLIIL